MRCRRCDKLIPNHGALDGPKLCMTCRAALARSNYPSNPTFSYAKAINSHHKKQVVGAQQRLQRQKTIQVTREKPVTPQILRSSSTSIQRPVTNILQLQCIVLFVPFDAGNNFYYKNADNGTFQADFIPSTKNTLSPFGSPGTSCTFPSLNNKAYPGHTVFEQPGDAMPDTEIAKKYSAIVWKHIQSCTHVRELDLLPVNPIERHLRLLQIVPEIIFFSEELKDAPFPLELKPHDRLTYRKIGSIKAGVSGLDAKNEISAYVLKDESFTIPILYDTKVLTREGCNHQEKWLTVQKILPEYRVYLEVAGVHLDAGYTGYVSSNKKELALADVGQFALDNRVDALLGDLNMDSCELKGGLFANHMGFKEGTDGKIVPVWTLSHSNTNAKNNYMGGMIVNAEQVTTEIMNLHGEETKALSRTLDDEFYSDHPAIVANYVKSFQ
jgi:hypothetical protein